MMPPGITMMPPGITGAAGGHPWALALAVEAVKAGRSVYFTTLAELIGSLAKAEREGALRERIRFLCRPQLLVVDEIGYLPVIAGGGNQIGRASCRERV